MATTVHLHHTSISPLASNLTNSIKNEKKIANCLSSSLRVHPSNWASTMKGISLTDASLTAQISSNARRSRGVVTMVIPFQQGDARQQPPPDLASYLFKNRIVYLGMPLVPAVTELIMAELLYLQYEDPLKPIYMYINSTGTSKDGEKLGYETEAFCIYDAMKFVKPPIFTLFVKPPIFTLCVGNAWGEAALLLAAGAKGNRSALPSATIMLKKPIGRFRGQATDIDIQRKEVREMKDELVRLYARHTGHSEEKIDKDIDRPLYLHPEQAVEYGVIDKVMYSEKGKSSSLVDTLRSKEMIS